MKSRRRRNNRRLSSDREHIQKFLIPGVVKRGSNPALVRVRRSSWRVAKIVAAVAVLCAIAYGGMQGWRKLFWLNPDYALKEVRFSTDGSLTRQQAIQTAGLQLGRNIFSYSRSAAREALARLPQVASVEVRRYPPNRIEVNVVERKPVAWVASKATQNSPASERANLLDERGVVFRPEHLLAEYEPMPIIRGVENGDIEQGHPIQTAEVVAALELLRRVRESGDFKVASIDVSKGYCMVVTNQRRSRLTFGLDEIGEQLERLSAVQSEAAQIGQDIATVNLMPRRNIPVTFIIPPPPEQEDSDTAEPPRPPKVRDTPRPETPAQPRARSTPAPKKTPTPKPRTAPQNDNNSVLKRFHAA